MRKIGRVIFRNGVIHQSTNASTWHKCTSVPALQRPSGHDKNSPSLKNMPQICICKPACFGQECVHLNASLKVDDIKRLRHAYQQALLPIYICKVLVVEMGVTTKARVTCRAQSASHADHGPGLAIVHLKLSFAFRLKS